MFFFFFLQQTRFTEITRTTNKESWWLFFPKNSLVIIYRFMCCVLNVCVCSWQRHTLMPTAGCTRAGTVAITLMKESQTVPAGTLCLRVGFILHTTALIQLLQQGLRFCLI